LNIENYGKKVSGESSFAKPACRQAGLRRINGEWEDGLQEVNDGFGDFIVAVYTPVSETFGDHKLHLRVTIFFYFVGLG